MSLFLQYVVILPLRLSHKEAARRRTHTAFVLTIFQGLNQDWKGLYVDI